MYNKIFQSTHPDMMQLVDNATLTDRYRVDGLFMEGHVVLNYTHNERMVIGGVAASSAITLPDHTEPVSAKGQPFLTRRELGIFNVGGCAGQVRVDDELIKLGPKDGLYVPMGTNRVEFSATSSGETARFYLVSAAAHRTLPMKKITPDIANPLEKGSLQESNERVIYQYIIPGVCDSCSLLVGLTELAPGSVWNTMPPHLHDRRSEIYFYFGLNNENRVFHFMGESDNIRHIVMENEQAVISPPWSIHMGAGTSNYSFIWAMAGENLDYTDMNLLDICQLQ